MAFPFRTAERRGGSAGRVWIPPEIKITRFLQKSTSSWDTGSEWHFPSGSHGNNRVTKSWPGERLLPGRPAVSTSPATGPGAGVAELLEGHTNILQTRHGALGPGEATACGCQGPPGEKVPPGN